MEGITYIKDPNTNKNYVQIDLEKHGELWQDFMDIIIAQSRKNEKKIPLSEVKRQLSNNEL